MHDIFIAEVTRIFKKFVKSNIKLLPTNMGKLVYLRFRRITFLKFLTRYQCNFMSFDRWAAIQNEAYSFHTEKGLKF